MPSKKTVSFSKQVNKKILNINEEEEKDKKTNWKENAKKNGKSIKERYLDMQDLLTDDLTLFSLDGGIDSFPDSARKDELYWLIDDLNISGRLPQNMLSGSGLYNAVAIMSEKEQDHPSFSAEEVKELFDGIANWKNSTLPKDKRTTPIKNGEEYIEHINKTARQLAKASHVQR